ncbi:HlyD family efflux transporter periplasmic adaptor subunit [Kaistia dalseonensis]|uniref:Multidrug resistance efflux pump n=1 Tax=Kaistia dalseonensis TaxID=410840 RepID=A0ABU0H3W1_9HYPH|nr:HlyD family efflux transporter periplasmic adaptor subunit [Kaistia dalseonensis]MCX5494409.1 HlyD family efflux transporter periplasmic adaptor subunit [Kaistia dalseonensis]MDQ0436988.1 multidrug resistance efflux pump [Kaistia dalseonensis]
MAQSMMSAKFHRGAAWRRLSAGLFATLALSLLPMPSFGAPAASSLPEIKARAIFLPDAPDFDVVRPIYSAGPAIVEDIRIGPDEVVTKGQILLTLRSPLLDEKIATTKSSLQRRSDYLQELTGLANQYESAILTLEGERRRQIGEAITTIENERDGYRKILDGKTELRSKGLETSGSTFQAQVQYDQSVNELMKQKLALLEVDSRIAQMQQQRYEQFSPLARQIEDQRIALGELETQYEYLRTIRAPSDGIVNSIFVTRGASIDAKDVLMTLSNANPTLQAYAFVDIADVPQLKAGMTVSLAPARARKDLDRPLSGTIRSISKTPLSRAEARNLFFDDDTVAYFIPGSIVYLVRIALAPDTPAGAVGLGDLATLLAQGQTVGAAGATAEGQP